MINLVIKKTAIVIVFLGLFEATSAYGQVVPDGTVNSRVTTQGNTSLINAGTTRGDNVFHSFQDFSVPTGNTAYFNNAASIRNIISRVTGNSASVIDGTLKSNGSSNLFFLNPNGITFGKNARLDIGGSFLGTTADSIAFNDGTEFSAITPQSSPLLTAQVPIGLNFINGANELRVSNTGQKFPSGLFSPTSGEDNPTGLQVSPGKTLALAGGDIFIDGGAIYAPNGRIEIGSVKQGKIALDTTNAQWSFSYDPQSTFGKIALSNRALLDATGEGGASIRIKGREIWFKEDSVALIQNQGVIPDKELRLEATDSIYIGKNVTSDGLPTGLYSEAINSGSGAQITLISPSITVQEGGVIDTFTFTSAKGGSISFEAQKLLKIEGSSPELGSQVNTLAFDMGKAGDIDISTSNLVLGDGGRLASVTFGQGHGGDISINANLVEVFGELPVTRQGSTIQAGSLGTGNAGSLEINTSKLILASGGSLSTSSFNAGNGGSLIINASEFIEVNGMGSEDMPETVITAEARIISPNLRRFFNLPPIPSGNSGSITINTPRLNVTNGGLIAVRNQGTGNAGELKISANQITLENSSQISATTSGGDGGDVLLNSNFTLLKNSAITASAQKQGIGGNITINSDLVAAIDKSTFSANAQNAQGGRIKIDTLGLFLSPDSSITATSQLGPQFDGSVEVDAEITNFTQDPDLDIQVDPPDLYSACGDAYRDTLAYYHVGTAGRPTSPITRTPADGGWLAAAKARYDQRQLTFVDPKSGEIKPLKRVVGWKTNNNGTITFVNDPREADQYAPAIAQSQACHSNQQAKSG